MGTIQIQNLSFKYSNMTENIFDHVNLQIDESWKLGLIGRNGRGKTTLLNILREKLEYDGKIVTNFSFNYFPQKVNEEEVTRVVMQNLGKVDDYNLWKLQIEMEKLQLNERILDLPYKVLSPGQKTKIQLAAMFVDEGSFQLIDEPTNHLDIVGRKVVEDYLKGKEGFIVISHDRHFLNSTINHVLSINRNDITLYKGNYDTWEYEKNVTDQRELREKSELKADISKLKISAHEKENWSNKKENAKSKNSKMEKNINIDKGFIGHKSAKMMKKSKSLKNRMDKNIAEKSKLLKNIEITDDLQMNFKKDIHNPRILEVKDFQIIFSKQALNQKISFTHNRGEVTALIGQNGVGKSTFIRALLNENVNYTGSINLQNNLRISYLQQNSNHLLGTIENYCEEKNISENDVYSALRKLGFERQLFNNSIETMSEGQKRKVALALSLAQPADLYIWDEPLNYLDVITRQQILDVIKKYQPSMLIIDHDFDFINEVATNKIEFQTANSIEN